MPPKAKLAAPIDRPLARAYLREFTGWSTAFPPGLSDPTSLRIMENVQINRDGSARIRPGLRYLSYSRLPDGPAAGEAILRQPVGSHEVFFLNDGTKAYLFAVRELDGTVGFRVLQQTPLGQVVKLLTDPGIDFSVPAFTPPAVNPLNFSAATTYVKYLQIDNKIFALSNAGEPMRRFTVGTRKEARKLSSIEKPEWTIADKLSVVHPDAGWINTGAPDSYRRNLDPNPSFEGTLALTPTTPLTGLSQVALIPRTGTKSVWVSSLPTRTNMMPYTLHNVPVTGVAGWDRFNATSLVPDGSDAFAIFPNGRTSPVYVRGPEFSGVEAGKTYKLAVDVTGFLGATNDRPHVKVVYLNSSVWPLATHEMSMPVFTGGRLVTTLPPAPAGATSMQIYIGMVGTGTVLQPQLYFNDVLVCEASESTNMFTGASGTNYFWKGTANASASTYHPPADVSFMTMVCPCDPSSDYWSGIYARAVTVARSVRHRIHYYDSTLTLLSSTSWVSGMPTTSDWTTRVGQKGTTPANAAYFRAEISIQAVPRSEITAFDDILMEKSAAGSMPAFFSGATTSTSTKRYSWAGLPNVSQSIEETWTTGNTVPTAETPTANTLISSDATKNTYNFGFFYTFSNEVGESAASQVTIVRTQRAWSSWRWELANASGEPDGTATTDPALAADQLVAIVPQAVWDAAIVQGATSWNLYMFTWSDQANVPQTAVRVATRDIGPTSLYGSAGWQRATPVVLDQTDDFAVLPTVSNRYNYSDPSKGGQGLVAADRMVMVYDPTASAVIRWSSNQQGDYSNFTAAKGGGYKTLTSGNLYVPACVKLWQNPQSVDTLTVLCMGVDSQSTSYYMMPAEVSQQSETTQIMGFEETTATPGTTSPYGVEVFNNALYHPLDDQLMKSTANNYNISHKTQTENIRDKWEELQRKQNIVSSQYDGRLYFIVNNPEGVPLEAGCMGNEIWVFDGQAETGTWSRWLIQATSLRKIEQRGRIFMSVVRPDGIFYLDPEYDLDDVALGLGGDIETRTIPWKLETNTQGANRAHDAWARLQQANITVGNFTGWMRYGIKGYDQHGKEVTVEKVYRSPHGDEALTDFPFDHDDMLRIGRDLKEWFFFAESVVEDGVHHRSYGQINLVQYRYAPISVNVGYEYGSVETFEYGHAAAPLEDRTNINGIPIPMLDARRP